MPHLALELLLFTLAAFLAGCLIGCIVGRLFPREPVWKDDLKWIKGVAAHLETKLNDFGITTFEQIASWREQDIAEFDTLLDFHGRIDREEWVEQAKLLAAGEDKAFERLYGSTSPGVRTRRS